MNVALVILDTLRKDFGIKYFDKLMKKFGFRSFGAVASSNWTVPSHFSMFTGLTPGEHGIHEIKENKDPIYQPIWEYDTIMKMARSFDYKIIWLTANIYLSEKFGYDGFYEYHFTFPGLYNMSRILSKPVVNFLKKIKLILKLYSFLKEKILEVSKNWPYEKGVTKTIEILRKLKIPDKKFLFINLLETHGPYPGYPKGCNISDILAGKFEMNEEIRKRIYESYKRSVVYLKSKFEEFLDTLLNFLGENSLIVITSDHGELLGEHNLISHGIGLWDELVWVPFWIRTPEEEKISGRGVISLQNIQRFFSRIFVDGEIDCSLLFSEYIISENWGTSTVKLPEDISRRVEKYRVRCTSDKGYVIYNVEEKKIEEREGNWKECLDIILKYIAKISPPS